MIPVVVTTELKGVFFGYVPEGTDLSGTVLRIEQARMCVYWDQTTRGVNGLAAQGPKRGCRVSPSVPAMTLQKITSVMETSPEAAQAWESGPWQS